jgi:NADH-quinone oxidoreductase subunit I
VVGLKITGVEFCKPWLPVPYPWLEVKNLATFRGHIELVAKDDDPKTPRCIMCQKCVKICPSSCISLQVQEPKEEAEGTGEEGAKKKPRAKKSLGDFRLNYTLCSLCGLCVQTCPVGSLRFSRDAYLVSMDRESLVLDLLKRLRSPAVPAGPSGRESPEGIYKVAELVKVPGMVLRFGEKLNPKRMPSHEAFLHRSSAAAEDGSARRAKA